MSPRELAAPEPGDCETTAATALNRTVRSLTELYAEAGIPLPRSRAVYLARRSLRARQAPVAGAGDECSAGLGLYPDPTGEAAVRHAMTVRRARR